MQTGKKILAMSEKFEKEMYKTWFTPKSHQDRQSQGKRYHQTKSTGKRKLATGNYLYRTLPNEVWIGQLLGNFTSAEPKWVQNTEWLFVLSGDSKEVGENHWRPVNEAPKPDLRVLP